MADVILGEFPKNPLEKLVVSIRAYRGFTFADIRLHFLGDNDVWHATKKGVTIPPDLWADFMTILGKVRGHLPAEDVFPPAEIADAVPAAQAKLTIHLNR